MEGEAFDSRLIGPQASVVGEFSFGSEGENFNGWVEFIASGDQGETARSYIFAPHRGDEAMGILEDGIQKRSNEGGRTITHIGEPKHEGSSRLFERHGYEKIEDQRGRIYYKKVFTPQKQEQM